ncbi:MAG: hypoxanthine phosphoribosyltransferase [Prevotella sp.]|nr:hypoxanthine phosphoribosyltransferase [Prevotella sp.]
MERVRIHDKDFVLMMKEEEILARIDAVAARINADLKGTNPLFLAVLNGAFMFAADLMKRITIPCEISFVKLASYEGTTSTGKVREIIGINEDIADRTIVIVEDIIDSGLTMKRMRESLGTRSPKAVYVCSLFVKRDNIEVPLKIDYSAFDIGNEFIVGYGLDYDQQGRNLRDLYVVCGE